MMARLITALAVIGACLSATPAHALISTPAPDASVSAPMSGERFYLSGQLPAGSAARTVHLQRLESGSWRTVASLTSSSGAYRFPMRISRATTFRVTSPGVPGAETAQSASRSVVVASQGVAVWVARGCGSDNRCGGTAFASGYVRPARENRLVVLQIKSGSTWKIVRRGRTDAAGSFRMPFSIAGWPQWTSRRFRVIAGRYAGSATALSSRASFMPGPTLIGRNVLRVDVNAGVFPSEKGRDYKGFATLSRDGVVQIDRARLDRFGVRGSSTAKFAKKPYNLRFDQKPAMPVFGMKADRSWTLLAMFVDQSFVRDKTALDLADKLSGMTWNPDSEYVEMFVNSEYRGAYLLTEKVKIDGDRVAVSPRTGMIMEVDGRNIDDPRFAFPAPHGLNFAFKDPDDYKRRADGTLSPEGVTPTKLSRIRSKVSAVESVLYNSSKRANWANVIDPLSAVDFYLVMEYFKDNDSDFWRSKFFSWDSGTSCGTKLCDTRLHFGPAWDFDRGAGNPDPKSPGSIYVNSPIGWNANGKGVPYDDPPRPTYRTHWYVQMWKIAGFRRLLHTRWDVVKPYFAAAYRVEVARNKALIGVGAPNDRKRWAGQPKWYSPNGSTYADEVQYVASWLKRRYVWMNGQLD